MCVWRKVDLRFDATCMMPKFKLGYELVNVWGAFWYYGKPPLVRIERKFPNKKQIKICDTLPCTWAISSLVNLQSFDLLEDNCGPHRAEVVRKYTEEMNNTRMGWPAQSPDLNPIEKVWGQMKSDFRKHQGHPEDKVECWLQIRKLSDDLPVSNLHKLIGSMAERITEIIAKSGGGTKY